VNDADAVGDVLDGPWDVDLAAGLEVEFESADEDVVDEEQHRMTDHAGLLAALDAWGARDVDDSPAYVNSVSGVVIRCVYEGRRTVAVGSVASTEECIGAVLDLIDMHLHDGAVHRGRVGASRSSRTTSGSDPGGCHEWTCTGRVHEVPVAGARDRSGLKVTTGRADTSNRRTLSGRRAVGVVLGVRGAPRYIRTRPSVTG
jgi:hypothetical protein